MRLFQTIAKFFINLTILPVLYILYLYMIFLSNFINISMGLYILLISLITGVNLMDIEEINESVQNSDEVTSNDLN
ncbi:hypothetical protein V1478_015736 [Vespula squamosa]|uniref:Uncharacterized protein n=1 Tax=Vespula squamosa TaxID=30214 RepID=A0ABD2A1P5_VESSQ